MRERPEPRCADRPRLFTSKDITDHNEAKTACLGRDNEGKCPLFDTCLATLRDMQAGPWQSGIQGTWAGKLYAGGKVKPADERRREHGTEKGYYQHKNRKEMPCPPCRKACSVAMNARLREGA